MEIMTSWKEEGLAQGLQQGLHEGLQQGIEQGLQQGLQQGERNLMLRLLTHRFGKLAVGVQEQIGALPVAQVGELGEALLDFSTLADLTGWLDQHATTEESQ